MKIVMLGTGATSGTLKTHGGADGFIDRLNEVHPTWRADYPELARVVGDCEKRADRACKKEPTQIGLDRFGRS